MAEKTYAVQFEAAEYSAIDTWMCRCLLSAPGLPPFHIHIQIVLKTVLANAVSTHDPISIAALTVEPVLTRLTSNLDHDSLPDVIRIPDAFMRSEGFAQKERSISSRIREGKPFHIHLNSGLHTSASSDKTPAAPAKETP